MAQLLQGTSISVLKPHKYKYFLRKIRWWSFHKHFKANQPM